MCVVNLFSNHEADTLKADKNQQMKVKSIRLPNQHPLVKQALVRFREASQHPDRTNWKEDHQTFRAANGILLSQVTTPADLAANRPQPAALNPQDPAAAVLGEIDEAAPPAQPDTGDQDRPNHEEGEDPRPAATSFLVGLPCRIISPLAPWPDGQKS